MPEEPDPRRIPSLDGLRAVSILLVVFGHAFGHGVASPALKALAPFFSGELGVLIFFVISGFLITTLLAEEIGRGVASLPRFYARRFIRLAPAQLVFIGALFMMTRLTSLHMSACQFATALTYTKNYACGSWIDGHLWSLSVEEQFYLLWPAALVFLPKRYVIVGALFLVSVAPGSRAIEYLIGHRSFFWLPSNADALMFGCLAAMFGKSTPLTRLVAMRPALGRIIAALVALFPVFLSSHLMFGAANVLFGQTLQALAATYLLLSFTQIRQGRAYRLLNARSVRWVGVLSYSLYLWQEPFFSMPADFGIRSSPLLVFPVNVIAAFSMAVLSYALIERPFLRLRRAFAARTAPSRAVSGEPADLALT